MDKYPKQVTFVRYEDLVIDPYQVTDKVMKFLMLPNHSTIMDHYLKDKLGKTRSEKKVGILAALQHHFEEQRKTYANPVKTRRFNSERVAFHWSTNLNASTIQDIENKCQVAMTNVGFATFQPNMTLQLPDVLSKPNILFST